MAQQLRSPSNSWLTGVSCPSATDCTAVGVDGPEGYGKTFAERWSQGRWVLQRTRTPAEVSFLYAVSCSSPDACTAAGYYESINTYPVNTLAERWNGRRWTLQTTPNPSGVSSELADVSCPSSSDCTAIGDYDASRCGRALAEYWNGKKWTVQATPTLNRRGCGGQFNGVSCPSSADCAAVGYYARLPDGLEQTLAERYQA